MRLTRLEVTDWRRFRDGPHELAFHDRLTVLAGPNEAGKSTLFEAIRRALFDRSRTGARWVERLVPYDKKGARPTVVLDFEHDGRTLRIRKSFGSKGEAALSELCDGEWTTLAGNEEAEEMLLDLLGAKASGRRDGSSPESWGAFQWLFVPQELRGLPEKRSGAASRIGLDQAGVSPELEKVRELVLAEYRETYTATTEKFSSRSEVRRLEEELEALREQRDEQFLTIRQLDEKRAEYDGISDALPQFRADATEAKKAWDAVQDEAVDLSGAQGKLEAAEATRNKCEGEAEQAKTVLKERLEREKAAETASKKYSKATEEAANTKAERDRIRDRRDALGNEATKVGDTVAELRRTSADAARCLRTRELKQKLETAQKRMEEAKDLDGRIRKAKAALTGETPDAKLVKEVETLVGQAQAKRLSVRQAALRVTVDGSPDLEVRLDGAVLDEPEGVAIKDVVIGASGGGTVRIEGDTQEAQRFTDEADTLEREIAKLLDPFGVETLDDLRQLREARRELESKVTALEAQRQGLDEQATSELEGEVAEMAAETNDLEQKRALQNANPDHDVMPEAKLKALVNRLTEDVAQLEKQFEGARQQRDELATALEEADRKATEAGVAYSVAETKDEGAKHELDRHRDRHGSKDKCRTRETETREALERATGHVSECRGAFERLKDDATARRDTAKRTYERLSANVQRQEARAEQLMEDLDRESAQGAYSLWAELERKLELEGPRLERLELRAQAIALLNKEIESVRSSAVNRVVAPIKKDLDELLAIATRGRYTLASLDDALVPDQLEGTGECRFEDGSTGLRELVATLVRMSVASHLAKTEPQTLILDDPCAHVSRERTARVVDLLNRITRESAVQAIILTHRQNEFAGLDGDVAEVGDL